MITFEHHGITVKCKPENAATYRAAMDKPPKPRTVAEKRDYPKFQAGKTTTADYLRDYAGFNARLLLSGFTFTHADRLAPMLDASAPEVWEEPDADYVPTIKTRKITPKQAIIQALDALKAGDIDTAQCILTEALK
jgi:hypothetical protein